MQTIKLIPIENQSPKPKLIKKSLNIVNQTQI